MSTLNDALNYLADKNTWKLLNSVSYPVTLSVGSNWTTVISSSSEIKNASEVCVEASSSATGNKNQVKLVNNNHGTENATWVFLIDTNTGSATVSSSYLTAFEASVDFDNGTIQARQFGKKSNASQLYVYAVYYR